jgi:hypothetical protein
MERSAIGGLKRVINLELLHPINIKAAIIQQLKTSLCQLPDIFVWVIFNFRCHFRKAKVKGSFLWQIDYTGSKWKLRIYFVSSIHPTRC